MRTRWTDFPDFERPFAVLDELRRQMDRVWTEVDADRAAMPSARFVTELVDDGKAFTLTAGLPGVAEGDLKLQANQDGLTVEARREPVVPEGYSVHRRERPAAQVSRTYAFPCPVDVEKIQANLTNGVLTVTVPKAPEAQPRTITVRAS
jgi:HSP20 family protein